MTDSENFENFKITAIAARIDSCFERLEEYLNIPSRLVLENLSVFMMKVAQSYGVIYCESTNVQEIDFQENYVPIRFS